MPRRMFSAMVPVKRNGSCRTTPKWLAECGQILLAHIDAIDEDAAALHVVEAHHQAGDGGFAGAGVADDGGGLAGLDGEGDVVQNPLDVGRERPVLRVLASERRERLRPVVSF